MRMLALAATLVIAAAGCVGPFGSLVMLDKGGGQVDCRQPGPIYVGLSGGSDTQVLRVIEERECVRQYSKVGYECTSEHCRRMAR